MTATTVRRTLIPAFTDAAGVYCVYLFVSIAGADAAQDFNFYVFLACALAAALVNLRLASRARSAGFVGGVNAAMVVLTEFFVFAAPNGIEGNVLRLIAGVLFAVPILHGYHLARHPLSANAALTITEMAVGGSLFLYLINLGSFEVPLLARGLCVAAILASLLLLAELRAAGPQRTRESGEKTASRTAFLSMVVLVCAAAGAACVFFFVPAVQDGLTAFRDAVAAAFRFLGAQIARFFIWLMSLLPAPEGDAGAPPEAAAPAGDAEAEAFSELSFTLTTPMLAAIAVAVCAIAAFVIFRLRKRRLRAAVPAAGVTEIEEGEPPSFLRTMRAAWRRLCRRLRLAAAGFRKRRTYEGVYLGVLRIARRRGLRKADAETPREILTRILARIPDAEQGRPETERLFGEIAARLDRRLYAGAPRPAFEAADAASAKIAKKLVRKCVDKAKTPVVRYSSARVSGDDVPR
ncbi:MAG: hypothetical protein LBR00_05615 [Clostridiales Family XIII bacterium]|jgi:hypothetical protein|nr:hypothetical protein [Clostridiales Family XIII bacterium]